MQRRSSRSDARDSASVLIVVDTSGAMAEDDRLEGAREGLGALVRELPAGDSVGLAAYSNGFRPLVPLSPVRQNRERLRRAVDSLAAAGGSGLYDATLEAYGILRELAGPDRIEAVLLLAHTADSASAASLERVRRLLGAQAGSPARVRVLTVAFDAGGGVRDTLAQLARSSGGKAYESGPDQLEAVLRRAWSEL